MKHFSVRMSFARSWGELQLGILTPDEGLSYPALRELTTTGETRALIAIKADEVKRLLSGWQEIDRLINGVSKGRTLDPVLRGGK